MLSDGDSVKAMCGPAIKGFNREWTTVTIMRDRRGDVIGWSFASECGTVRNFTNSYWEDPHGAAMRAMETHRCSKESVDSRRNMR